MRFAARLAIAIATLLGSAVLCWGQPPGFGGGALRPRVEAPNARTASSVSMSPPTGVEGTWVADEGDGSVMTGSSADGSPGMLTDAMGPTGDCQCPECAGGGLCDDGGLGGHGAMGHALATTDLWTEVHLHRRTWVQVDYLSMWAKGNQVPALVTTSPLGTPQAQAGILPESATTTILFGNEKVDTERRDGGRISFGYWLVDGEFWGVEGQYFALKTGSTNFRHTSIFSDGVQPGDIILARPFFNVDPNLPAPREDAALIAFPDFVLANSQGPLDGTIDVKTTSNVQSAGALLRKLIWIDFTKQCRLDLLFGYRFFRIDDSVIINDAWDFTPQSGPLGPISFRSEDIFSTKNLFNGGELGLKYQHYHGPLSVELIGKIACGNTREVVYINGTNAVTAGGTTTTGVGGLLAQPTNIGTYRRDVFAVLPEANVNLRWDLTRNLRATVGYTFIYTNRVQRSGDAIDLAVNPTQIGGTLVGEPRPAFGFTDTTYWVHGFSGGFEYRW